MAILVTYDVQRSHIELKRQLLARGFYSCVSMADRTKKLLPNTTVMYNNDDHSVVVAQFDAAVGATTPAPGLEKVLYARLGDWWLNSNQSC